MNEKITSHRVLALDLGPSSIGWALIDEPRQQIIALGTRIFPEGVADYGLSKEAPKNQTRRVKRGMRRQVQRRARRKRNLRAALVHAGIFPDAANQPRQDPARIAWEQEAFDSSVYELREKALREKLSLVELGRVFLHLAQRRGFQSNRKTDKAKQKEDSDTLKEISQLEASIQAADKRTLGEYLSALQADNPHERLRGRHTRRDMLLREFDAVWEAQAKHHPDLLTDQLKHGERPNAVFPCESESTGGKPADLLRRFGLRGMMFFQRKMYWPQSAIGRCELDPSQTRCPRADRAAQEFRLLQELNNLRVILPDGEIRPLTDAEFDDAVALLHGQERVKFEDLADHLDLPSGTGFNLQAGERKALDGMLTDALLVKKKYFGRNWHDFAEDKKNAIVRAILDADETRGLESLVALGVEPTLAESVIAVSLKEGHSNYGLATIEKLLPFLRQRMPLLSQDARCAVRAAGFKPPWEREVKVGAILPMPPKITNPLVRQAIFEVRKLVNAVVKEHGRPDAIHVELAREVKGNAIQRARQSREMRDREAIRKEAVADIRAASCAVSRDAIERVLLWKEQRKECMYSGRPISLAELLGGEVDIDHLLPYSQSLDDSLMNKVVCFRAENQAKGNRTLHEWLDGLHPEKYEKILQRAAKLPLAIRNRKFAKFTQPTCQLDDFIARQLTDTAFITRTVVAYLRHVCPDVLGTKGQHTARLRNDWGLNTILHPEGDNAKSRDDHRHHAVDAVVVALTNRSRLQQLAATRRQDPRRVPLPEPWPGFRDQAASLIAAMYVSHRVPRGIFGPLHDETIYGATQQVVGGTKAHRPWAKNWKEEEGVYVLRKPLESLSLNEVDKIRDDRIRELVVARLQAFGVNAGRKKRGSDDEEDDSSKRAIPKDAWKEPLLLYPRKGQKAGTPTVIKKVRITKPEQSIVPLREGGKSFVKPGSIHHVALFEVVDAKGKTKRIPRFVSMLEAKKRKRAGLPVVERVHPDQPDARFVMYLRPGEMLRGVFKGIDRLVLFNTAASTSFQMWFVGHTDARPSAKAETFSAKPNTLKGEKVSIDILGRLVASKA
jgi:CRISPR-associated endonuclease Csn1